jgi:sulfatase maturation enzyme AslB (radical SAM superfamily)
MSAELKNGAFCVLPFIEKFQNLNGKQYLCCYSDIPVTPQSILQIQNGIKTPECHKCYKLESDKVISPRQKESIFWFRDSEVKEYITNWSPESNTQTFFYDIRYSNKCNLACIGCNPEESSLWAKELKVDIDNYPLNFTIDELLSAKKIYLAGGEPLIIDEFINLIKCVAEKDVQPEVVINTNLTSITEDLQKSLSKIKNLTLTVSIDGYESVNEYHRWPLKWTKLLDNLQWIRKNIQCTIQMNSVVDAVTILNIDQLIKIEYLIDQWTLSILTTPTSLLIKNLPEHLKSIVADNFKNIKQSKFYKKDPIFKTRVENILLEIFAPGDPAALSKFIDTMDQRRNINHKNYLGVKLT